ncbi:MAG: GMC family oxidoreductase [Chloroflexota bacterium]
MPHTLIHFNAVEAQIAEALFERLFPADAEVPGATEIGVLTYIDLALAGAEQDKREIYRRGLAALNQAAFQIYQNAFHDCSIVQQNALISQLEQGLLPDFHSPPQQNFFTLLLAHLQEGLFSDPVYGGNQEKKGWEALGHPGVWLENSAEENLTDKPVDKGGKIQSMADVGYNRSVPSTQQPDYQQVHTSNTAAQPDVILVGLGAMGSIVAPILAKAGLKVLALEAGPWRTKQDFLPDELGHAYYARASMGQKFGHEVPQWRREANESTSQEATFSLGRMMNGVGGSVVHYGAWLRRFHPHHFQAHARVKERWGLDVLPEGCTLANWPISYADLEPYYNQLDHLVGIAGDAEVPFIPRSQPHPMPAMRPFRMGEIFKTATNKMGLHPYPVPVGMNTVPYDGRPATTYTAWSNGFGSFNDAKWHPALSAVPEALDTGNLDLRTHCRVTKILTDSKGHANGVEYIDANGQVNTAESRTVILCSYTFENIRLMLLSGDNKHPDGLGNNRGQVGKHFMTKMFAHVDGYFPNTVFNRHTGPAAQGIILDDYLADDFNSHQHGFIGGATLGAENQFLPLQISREALPDDVPKWGQGYKEHLRQWQHFGVVRIQPDTLSYRSNYLDLDPRYRDRSGLGLPVIRITYDMRDNEQRIAEWMETKSEAILREMGATKTWRGPRFTGVGSSHDLGGCRMGHDPVTSVVDANLQVHDTPGLYVFGGATFPTCPGINPTLTMWAVCLRAAEKLLDTL